MATITAAVAETVETVDSEALGVTVQNGESR